MVVDPQEEIFYCRWHPKTETMLRCYQCNTPICVKCMQRTPVGYICPDCQRGRQQRYEQTHPQDYLVAGVVAVVLGGVIGFLPLVGWFTLFLSPAAGGLVGELIWRAVGRRYGSQLWLLAAGGITLGALPYLLATAPTLVAMLAAGSYQAGYALLWFGVHLVFAIGAAAARLRLQ